MRVLIIAYGSIGKRHYQILNGLKTIKTINIVTKQNIKNVDTFKQLSDIKNLSIYDYFIIASETFLHYQQLKYICNKVNNKKILVEKPLYDKKNKKIITNNLIFTAYNLRFHPVLERLKSLLLNKRVYYANIICGQYLPTWRPTQDYKKSYSADIHKGGGVLRDLSHELDYAIWLFGDIDTIQYINTKISDLEINSDDIFTAIAITKKKTIINVSIDYISKTLIRKMLIHTQNNTIEVDMINNTIITNDKNKKTNIIKIEEHERNYSYTKMHEAIISDDLETMCSFNQGKDIIDIIDGISFV